jgi:8-oxo-dGTP pyrophosphatase MutT (NUDIX family)
MSTSDGKFHGAATAAGLGEEAGEPAIAPIPRTWSPVPSTAAVIVVDGKDYLLQLRDRRPDIWYPGHWGLFGGQSLPGEPAEACIRRELAEELGLDARELRYFMTMSFEFSFAEGSLSRSIFELHLGSSDVGRLRLREGRAVHAFERAAIAGGLLLVPCDRFALDLHMQNRSSK